jgi:hypothetical protein
MAAVTGAMTMKLTNVGFLLALFLAGCGDDVSGSSSGPTTPPVAQQPAPPAGPPQSLADPRAGCGVETGGFELVADGFVAYTSGTAFYKYYPCEKLAFILLPDIRGVSNSTRFSLSPLPDFLTPATVWAQNIRLNAGDNDGVTTDSVAIILPNSPTILILNDGKEEGWTDHGTKGLGGQVFTLFLD